MLRIKVIELYAADDDINSESILMALSYVIPGTEYAFSQSQ